MDIHERNLESLNGCVFRRLDVRRASDIISLAQEFPEVDVLLNSAGYVHTGTVLECSEDDWDRSFDLTARAIFLMIRGFLPGMLRLGRGSIINVASAASGGLTM